MEKCIFRSIDSSLTLCSRNLGKKKNSSEKLLLLKLERSHALVKM